MEKIQKKYKMQKMSTLVVHQKKTKYLSVRSNKLKILVYMILIGKILRNNLIHLKHIISI